MDGSFSSFSDELQKIAGLTDLWQRFMDVFRSDDEKVQRRVNYQFSPKAGPDKWEKLVRHSRDPSFVKGVTKHPDSDSQLVQHVQSMHELSRGAPVGKIQSATSPGKTYEIRTLSSGGLGCQCGDWRFKGSVTPGAG